MALKGWLRQKIEDRLRENKERDEVKRTARSEAYKEAYGPALKEAYKEAYKEKAKQSAKREVLGYTPQTVRTVRYVGAGKSKRRVVTEREVRGPSGGDGWMKALDDGFAGNMARAARDEGGFAFNLPWDRQEPRKQGGRRKRKPYDPNDTGTWM